MMMELHRQTLRYGSSLIGEMVCGIRALAYGARQWGPRSNCHAPQPHSTLPLLMALYRGQAKGVPIGVQLNCRAVNSKLAAQSNATGQLNCRSTNCPGHARAYAMAK